MIKYCKVLSFNKITKIVVAMFENDQIQFISNSVVTEPYIYIKKTVAGYTITNEHEYKDFLKNQKRRTGIKTTETETTVTNKVD